MEALQASSPPWIPRSTFTGTLRPRLPVRPIISSHAHRLEVLLTPPAALQDDIANLGNIAVTGGERRDATDHILAGISRLTTEVSDASEYAPPRDQMIYNQVRLSHRSCVPESVLGCIEPFVRLTRSSHVHSGPQSPPRTAQHPDLQAWPPEPLLLQLTVQGGLPILLVANIPIQRSPNLPHSQV